jgi:hypothetical protein
VIDSPFTRSRWISLCICRFVQCSGVRVSRDWITLKDCFSLVNPIFTLSMASLCYPPRKSKILIRYQLGKRQTTPASSYQGVMSTRSVDIPCGNKQTHLEKSHEFQPRVDFILFVVLMSRSSQEAHMILDNQRLKRCK